MLNLYRRRQPPCRHTSRRNRNCNCPIWVQGSLRGEYLRRALDLRSWAAASSGSQGGREGTSSSFRSHSIVQAGLVPLMIRFATAGRSVAVYTETLGTKRHHGKVALLVNEHSASAAEMVAALASEHGLATLVGTKTAGLLVATSAFSMNARVDAASDSRAGSGG